MLGMLGFSSLFISVVFCVYITKAITVPVSELELAAGKLEQGQLSSTAITYTSRDELGHLADSMRSVVNSPSLYCFSSSALSFKIPLYAATCSAAFLVRPVPRPIDHLQGGLRLTCAAGHYNNPLLSGSDRLHCRLLV